MKVEMGSRSSWWALSRLNCSRKRRCARWGQAFDDGCDGGVQMRHSKSSLVIHHMTILPFHHQVRRSTSSIHAGTEERKDVLIYLRPYTAGLNWWSRCRTGVFELLHLYYGFHNHASMASARNISLPSLQHIGRANIIFTREKSTSHCFVGWRRHSTLLTE
jgi:hypothetical protein